MTPLVQRWVNALRAPDHRRHLGTVLVVVVVAGGSGVAVAVMSSVPMSTWGYGAGLVAFLTAGPALIVRYARRREGLSPLPAITGFFILEFAAGAIFYRKPRVDSVLGDLLFAYTPGAVGIALVIAFGSWALLVAGYFLSHVIDGPVSHLPRPQVNDVITGTAVILIVVGFAARAMMVANGWYFHITDSYAEAGGLRNIVVVFANLPLIATAMIGARYYRERPSAAMTYWALVLLEAAWVIPSGERSRLVSLGLMLIVVRTYGSPKRFPTGRTATLAVIGVLVIFPLGAAYRTISGTTTGYQSDPMGQLQGATSQILTNYKRDPLGAVSHGIDQTLQRFAGITSVAAIAHRGTTHYPVGPREAVSIYAGALVPRALLPSKADASTLTNEFGYRYGIIRPGNTSSVAMTSVGDLWGTFGFGGLAVGMLILGGLVRGLDVYLGERRENYAVLGVYGAILGSFLLAFETSIATGLLQTLRALVIYIVAIGLAAGTVRMMRGYPVTTPPLPASRRPPPPGEP